MFYQLGQLLVTAYDPLRCCWLQVITCAVVGVLTLLSHDINCLSAFSPRWLLTLLGTGLPAPVRAKYPH